jgi:hypothetical protein
MADNLSSISEAIQKASEAYTEAMTAVSKTIEKIATQASGPERDRVVENWLRVARMSKDGIVSAMEHGFEMWQAEVRRMVAAGTAAGKPLPNPMEAWAENWRKATEAFSTGGNWNEEARKQAEMIQKTLADGMRAWQRLWEPEKR